MSDQDSNTMDGVTPASTPLAVRYELLGELGRGGMGIVYKARDRETGEIVALKVLKPEIAADELAMDRFKNELRLARKITHKNVCRIHEFSRAGETAYISMEFVEGESLRAVLSRVDGLSIRHGLKIIRQVITGLGEAHTQGVVHRDLKPENILIARDGTAKVMDFGVARSVEGGLTQAGALVGTPAYMSPEQAEGKPADPRSDIYALGLILYEMFTGTAAVSGDTPFAVALKQIRETPQPAREVEPSVPVHIERAIAKCLEKNPSKRFQSVGELEAALAWRAEAKPAAVEGAETPLPVHLTRWQASDWLLAVAAIAGVALFFPFFNRTSLAPRSKVSFDHSVLRRIAQEYAQRLGAPVVGEGRIEMSDSPERYDFVAKSAGARAALELTNNPVHYWNWQVNWENGTGVSVDNSGSLLSIRVYRLPTTENLSLEEVRRLAEDAVRRFFDRDPARLAIETALSENIQGRTYCMFVWADTEEYHGLRGRYRARLFGRQIIDLSRFYDPPLGYMVRDIIPLWQLLPWLALVLILVVVGFSQRRLVDVRARWRVGTAALISVAGMWFVWQLPLPLFAKIFFLPTLGLANGVTTFFALVPVELSVRRMAPAKLVSLARLFTLTAASEACGLAIVRGTCVGLALLGADTFLVWLGTSFAHMSLDSFPHIILRARGFLGSPLSSVHALYATLLVFGMTLLVTLFTSLMARLVRRPWLALFLATVLSVLIVPAPFSSMGAVQPYHWKALLLFFDLLVLALTFSRFDVLTLAWAAFTFAFCWENYPLLVMLSPAGVLEPWIDFTVFGVFVLAAAAVAFKVPLRAAYRRAATAFE